MRLRIMFSKQGALRYTSTLDLHRIWERSARRAELPLAYSQGFHPQPKIQLAAALPLGFSSRCEVVDLWLVRDPSLDGLVERVQTAVPPGLHILSLGLADERGPALQTLVESAEYEVTLLETGGRDELSQRLAALMDAVTLPRERRGKSYDLRPLLEELALETDPLSSRDGLGKEVQRVFMRLAAREGATGRPDEVLAELGIPLEDALVERTKLIFREPIGIR